MSFAACRQHGLVVLAIDIEIYPTQTIISILRGLKCVVNQLMVQIVSMHPHIKTQQRCAFNFGHVHQRVVLIRCRGDL